MCFCIRSTGSNHFLSVFCSQCTSVMGPVPRWTLTQRRWPARDSNWAASPARGGVRWMVPPPSSGTSGPKEKPILFMWVDFFKSAQNVTDAARRWVQEGFCSSRGDCSCASILWIKSVLGCIPPDTIYLYKYIYCTAKLCSFLCLSLTHLRPRLDDTSQRGGHCEAHIESIVIFYTSERSSKLQGRHTAVLTSCCCIFESG